MISDDTNIDLGKREESYVAPSPARCGDVNPTSRTSPSSSDRWKIGSWNVRSLFKPGKLANVLKEMTSLELDVMGVAETFWKDSGEFTTTLPNSKDRFKVIFSGGEKSRRGTAMVIRNKAIESLMYYQTISDRIILAKYKGRPVDILIIQVYAPTTAADDAEIEQFYEELDNIIKTHKKCRDMLLVIGDYNTKIGEGRDNKTVGPHGLGTRNERGNRLPCFTLLETDIAHNSKTKFTRIFKQNDDVIQQIKNEINSS